MELPVIFKSKNQRIVGILHRPEDKQRHPAVILCHGLFSTKSEAKYVKMARRLCKERFVVLRFDFRGCGDSEGREEEYCFSSEIEDIGAALKFLLKQKFVDKNKIGLLGHSHAGATVVFAASRYKEFKCLVISGATAVPEENWTEEEIEEIERKGYLHYKSFKAGLKLWLDSKKFVTKEYIKKIHIPLLIIHGGNDTIVSVENSKILFRNANEPKKLVIIKNSDHSYSNYEHLEEFLKVVTAWFKRWLFGAIS